MICDFPMGILSRVLTLSIRSGDSWQRIIQHREVLTRCLQPSAEQVDKRAGESGITSTPEGQVIITSSKGCGTALVRALSEGNYAIVSEKSIRNGEFVGEKAPVSGPFMFRREGNKLLLSPNEQSIMWRDHPKAKRYQLSFTKMSDADLLQAEALERVDALKTVNPKVLKHFGNAGFSAVYAPMMTWFLAPWDASEAAKKTTQAILADINAFLDRKSLKVLDKGPLDEPARTFFPEDFRCDRVPKKVVLPLVTRKGFRVHVGLPASMAVTDDRTLMLNDIAAALQKLGYQADTDPKPGDGLNLALGSIHLGADVRYILQLVFNTFQIIPDHTGRIKGLLAQADEWKAPLPNEKDSLCEAFAGYNHVPLGHRRYAFLARHSEYQALFERQAANIWLPGIVNISPMKKEE